MAKKRFHYKFNPDTLSFDVIHISLATRIKRLLYMFLVGSVIAFVWIFIYTLFFDTPKEMRLDEANKNVLVSYDMLLKKIENKQQILTDIEDRDNKIYRAVFEEDPIPASIRNAGFGGVDRYASFEDMENASFVVKVTRELDILTKKAYIQSKSFDRIAQLTKDKEKMQLSMPIGAPINLNVVRLSSLFGGRTHPVYGVYRSHEGIDLSGKIGTPIYAAGEGLVTEASYSTGGYGNVVYIDHGFGYSTRYAHMSSINAYVGQRVKRGDKVGELGNSGTSTGPHLHYEVRLKGQPMNPLNYFENNFTGESVELLTDIPVGTN